MIDKLKSKVAVILLIGGFILPSVAQSQLLIQQKNWHAILKSLEAIEYENQDILDNHSVQDNGALFLQNTRYAGSDFEFSLN